MPDSTKSSLPTQTSMRCLCDQPPLQEFSPFTVVRGSPTRKTAATLVKHVDLGSASIEPHFQVAESSLNPALKVTGAHSSGMQLTRMQLTLSPALAQSKGGLLFLNLTPGQLKIK